MIQAHNLAIGTRLLPASLSFPEGQLTHVIGPNGSGKSTLLAALAGVLNYEGKVEIAGMDLAEMSLPDMAKVRAYLPQAARPAFNMPVYQYLSLSIPTEHQNGSRELDDAIAEITALLKLDNMLVRTVHHLSGGEWQRVRLAACCLQIWRPLNPLARLLILDEPAAPLDVGQEKYLNQLIELVTSQGTSVVVANHDLNTTLRRADHVVMLNNGVVEAVGCGDEVLTPDNIGSVYQTSVSKIEVNGKPLLIFNE
ncbi:vitamin B12 ABC transporter ATP-binding protein BtuD [Vibrio sp. 10N]|uniref:vitamin B12 ABC transporter ATP-binding protein BtuD n=1 Tax=Vibrio sp. 10N TaxID=3058938 RepID=UPI00281386B3|nr:vitamin B12 ABC transporter ATP-binding protein BtuD [Vibrio sp. 10N]